MKAFGKVRRSSFGRTVRNVKSVRSNVMLDKVTKKYKP